MTVRKQLPDVPTWKPKFSQEALQELAGTRQFDRGFRQQPISEGELMFPRFKTCYEPGLALGDMVTRKLPTYIGVDLSSPRRPGNALVAIAIDPQTGQRFPVDLMVGAWTSPETAQHIAEMAKRHTTEWVMVENNAYQDSIIDWIKANKSEFNFWQRVDAHTTGRQKSDTLYGLPGLEVEFKNKAWSIASSAWAGHKTTCQCPWCRWRKEFELYPRAAATDMVMATWFAVVAIQRYGHLVGPKPKRRGGLGSISTR